MKIGILTGGGDCPGLNPAIRGFVLKAIDYGHEVYGIREGWKGLVKGIVDEKPLTVECVEEIISQGGTMLRTSRTNPYKDPAQTKLAHENFRKFGFDAIVALGGEDTLGVAAKLWKDGFPTVGVPKTMDNDLSDTDYTFGFDTAVAADVEAVDRLRDTAKSHSRIIVLEVMGRHAGWVALYAAIAGGADWVLLPEEEPDLDAMCEHIKAVRARGKNYAIIVASEGAELPQFKEAEQQLDAFGHMLLGERRVGETIAKYVEEKTGFETRSAVMGHIQRGGPPTAFDRVLGTRVGIRAAQCVHEKDFGKMVAVRGTEVVPVPIDAAVGTLKVVPKELLESVRCLCSK